MESEKYLRRDRIRIRRRSGCPHRHCWHRGEVETGRGAKPNRDSHIEIVAIFSRVFLGFRKRPTYLMVVPKVGYSHSGQATLKCGGSHGGSRMTIQMLNGKKVDRFGDCCEMRAGEKSEVLPGLLQDLRGSRWPHWTGCL